MIMKTPDPPDIKYRSVLELLRKNASDFPEETCLISIEQNNSLTWRDLYKLSNQLSAWLHEKHIGANDRILVLADNSLETLVLYYGVQRHGATFCCVNVEINENHLQEIIQRLSPKIIFWDSNLKRQHPKIVKLNTSLSIGSIEGNHQLQSPNNLFTEIQKFDGEQETDEVSTELDDSVICFTSGTTDQPKGVIHSFGNYNFIGAQTAYLWGLKPTDRVLEYRSFAWSSSHQIVLQPLLFGGGCVVFSPKFSITQLFEWIRKHQITKSIGIPAVINMLLDRAITMKVKHLKTLEFMSSSTAPLLEEQHKKFEKHYGIKLIQHYGMSEGGTVAGNHHLDRKIGTVGKPGISQNLKIVNESGNTLNAGEEGEIEIGGPQNATAYLLPNGKLQPVRGRRLKTGDLGIVNKEGYLRITGRAKDIIIRGGVNISPLEIDEIVMKHPDVADVCTIGVPDPTYGEAIVCYVVSKKRQSLIRTELLQFCAANIPEFKRPTDIIIVQNIEKNQRGKVDRNAMRTKWKSLKNKGSI
tara:strand:- start:1712 stop:3289 length:1578 start_codon:yes stop_codon:yes gene_type:complete